MNKTITLLKTAFIFSLGACQFLLSTSALAQGSWTQKSSLPASGREQAVSFSIGSKAYLGTGLNGSYYNDFWEYDPALDTWTQKANFMGSARYGAIGFSIGDKGYVTGGYSGGPYSTDFFEYFPDSNLWTQKTSFAGGARMCGAAFSIGTKGYVGTGAGGSYYADLWEYDQTNDSWAAKANFPGVGRYGTVGFSMGTKGYIGVGTDGGGNFFQDLYEWDQGTDSWTQKASMGGLGRHYLDAFVINSKAYIGTGAGSQGWYQDLWEWDQLNDTWTQTANFPGGQRQGISCFAVNGKGYMGLGGSNDLWEFDPCGGYTPTITPDGPTTFCTGGSVNLSVSTANSYLWNTSATTAFLNVSTSGNYKVTVTNMAGCIGSDSVDIIVNASPITPIASNNGPLCEASTLNLTANFSLGATYFWSGPNGFTSTLQNPSLAGVTTAESGVYTLNTSMNGCTSETAYTNVTVNPNPFASILSTTNVSCNGSSDGSITVTTSGGTTPYLYSWSPGGGNSSTASGLTAGTYTAMVTDAAGCTAAANNNILEPAALTAFISSVTNVSCGGGTNGSIGVTASGGTSPYTYLWSNGGSGSSTNGQPAGGYTVTVSDINGCNIQASDSIFEPSAISATSSSTNVTCNGLNDGSASVSVSGGNAPYTYSWSPVGGNASSASSLSAGSYAVTVTDDAGCSTISNAVITAPTGIAINAGTDIYICEGASATLNGSASGGTLPYTSTTWSPSGTLSNANILTPDATPATTTIYTLSVTDNNGCTVSNTVTVTVNANPSLSINSNSPVCAGQSINFNSTSVGANAYNWSGPNGYTSTLANPGIITSGVNNTGTYTLNITDSTGCSNSAQLNVVINALPNINAGADQALCTGASLNFTATGGTNYSWTGPNGFVSSISNPSISNVSVINSGVYVADASDINGCSGIDSVVVNISASPIINGVVTFLGSPVNGGTVSAYSLNGAGAFSFVGSTTINGAGNYSFTNLNQGNYFIKAQINPSTYIAAIPTYASGAYAWINADTVYVTCGNSFTSNVAVIQAPQLNGTGAISGHIFGGNGPLKTWQQGDPVPGVDVSLEQNPGSVMLAQTTTDAAGAYSFNNVPNGTFSIYVDVPGLDMSASYNVIITDENNTFVNAMFYVDSTGTIDTVSAIILGNRPKTQLTNSVSVFPNPYSGYTNISYEVSEKSNVNVEVYNVLGEKVTTLVNTNKDAGKYNERFSAKNYGAGAGIYFVRININGKVQTVRVIETN